MMKFRFTPEMFDPGIGPANDGQKLCTYSWAARKANQALDKYLETLPMVYGYGETPCASSLWNMNGPTQEREHHTHFAILFDIEELPKKECDHSDPGVIIKYNHGRPEFPIVANCIKCGAKLKAKWEVEK